MKYAVFLLLLAMVSCAPIKVAYDFDETVTFSQYRSYNYYSNSESGLSELDNKRLLQLLDETLQQRGFSLSDTPDFYIAIQSSIYQTPNRSSVGIGIGSSGRNVGGGISIGVPVGEANVTRTIQFDFVDEDGSGLFWQAVSESAFNPNDSPEKRTAKLRAIVEKVLEGFPPKQ